MTFQKLQDLGYELTEEEYQVLVNEMLDAYIQAYREIDNKLKTLYAKDLAGLNTEEYYNFMVQRNRLDKLLDNISKNYNEAATKTRNNLSIGGNINFANVYYRQLYAVNWSEQIDIFQPIKQEIINLSVFGTEKAWRELSSRQKKRWKEIQPKYGTLSERLYKNKTDDLSKLRQSLTQSFILGDSYTKNTQKIRKILNTSANNAERIARTEGHRNQMAGNYAMTQNARRQGAEVRRQIVSVLDVKTRQQSGQVDDKLEDDNGLFTYPGGVKVAIPGNSGNPAWDINDREAVINNVAGLKPTTRRARDPVTGKSDIISYDSFDNWMEENNLMFNKNGKIVLKN